MKKTLIYGLMVLAVLFIALGVLGFYQNKTILENDYEAKPEKEDNAKIARSILDELFMDNYAANLFNQKSESNKNTIDIYSEQTYINLFMQNDAVEKYSIVLTKSPLGNLIYIKYSDFIKYSKLVFDSEPKYNYQDITLAFSKLNKNENGEYDVLEEDIAQCDFENNTDVCYVLIGSGNINMNSKAEFSNLKLTDNIITGDVIKYYDESDKSSYIDGTFEFEFEHINDKYIAKSFKITKINEQ